jgi:hypothetical protein
MPLRRKLLNGIIGKEVGILVITILLPKKVIEVLPLVVVQNPSLMNGKRLVSVMVMVLPMNGVKARAVLVGGYWMMLVQKN